MSHEVETMAYAGEVPWHGLGVKVEEDLTPKEMVVAAGLDWKVTKRPIQWTDDEGTLFTTHDYNVLTRDSDGSVLGPCGKNYTPIQNEEVFTFFDKFVKSGDMKMGTAGSLDSGRKVWGLANIRQGFKLPGGDEVQGHLLINHPHQWGKALTIMFTPVRVVCNNTLQLALSGNTNFRMPHIHSFDDIVQSKAEEALGLSTQLLDEFQERAEFLARIQYDEEVLDRFIAQLFQPQLVSSVNDKVDRTQFNRTSEAVWESVWTQPGAKTMSEGSWWSALNGVTYYVDHKAGRDRDASLQSAWFGPRAATKRRALDLATEYAEAA